jgi:hypothetical protein
MFPRTLHSLKRIKKNVNKKAARQFLLQLQSTNVHEDLRLFVRVSRGQLAKYLLPRRLLRTKYGNTNETYTLCLTQVPESLTAVTVKMDSMSAILNVPIQPE